MDDAIDASQAFLKASKLVFAIVTTH